MTTLIVPVFNSRLTISRCVESIISQSSSDWELLLVDDGSIDGSSDICKNFAEIDSRISYYHKDNGGVSSARNLGLAYAKGDYVMFLDSDDYLSPTCLSLVEGKDVDMLIFGISLLKKDGSSEAFSEVQSRLIETDAEKQLFIKNYIVTDQLRSPCAKFYKSIIAKHHMFNESMVLGEDTEYVLRCIKDCKSIITLPHYYYVCRDNRQEGRAKYCMPAEKAASHLETVISAYKDLGVWSAPFEELMFDIYYSVIDRNLQTGAWYSNNTVRELEKQFVQTKPFGYKLDYWRVHYINSSFPYRLMRSIKYRK